MVSRRFTTRQHQPQKMKPNSRSLQNIAHELQGANLFGHSSRRTRRHPLSLLVMCVVSLSFVIAYTTSCTAPTGSEEKTSLDGGSTDKQGGCQSDADCTDPQKPSCLEGVCHSKNECSAQSDCKDPGKPKCLNNKCVPECVADSECSDPKKPRCEKGKCSEGATCKTDADCKTQETPRCDRGLCVKGSDCVTDKDCKEPAKPKCQGGLCIEFKECAADKDCTNPLKPTCIDSKCVEKPECKDNFDCVDPRLPVCQDRKCVASSTGCLSDNDCRDPNKPRCNQGKCDVDTTSCVSSDDCKDPALPVCLPSGLCGPAECTENTNCQDPQKPKCEKGECIPECATSADCTDANKPRCAFGACLSECKQDEDCTTPGKTICKNSQCTAECTNNSDCTDTSLPVCYKNQCVPPTGCREAKDCLTDPKLPHCELKTGQCRGCVLDTQCKTYELCEPKTYVCKLKPGGCASKTDCTDANKPFCEMFVCVACLKTEDCKQPLTTCKDNACTPVDCKSDDECKKSYPQQPFCHADSKRCVACTQISQCATGMFCDEDTGTCKKQTACTKDDDCKLTNRRHCDTQTKTCVLCTQNNHCPQPPNTKGTALCESNACIDCKRPDDCKLGYLCQNSKCIEGCQTNRDCPTDRNICDTTLKKCVECSKNTDCPNQQACDSTTHKCAKNCTADKDCGGTSTGIYSFCNTNTGTCASCLPEPYSPLYTQFEKGCYLPPKQRCDLSTDKCVECRTDKHCAVGAGSSKASCDTTKKICKECITNDPTGTTCLKGYVCDLNTYKCIVGCRQDSECQRGQVCGDKNRCVQCSTNNPTCPTGKVCEASSGRCVECLSDKDCKTGSVCDTRFFICIAPTGRTQCMSCKADKECAANHDCITTKIDYQGKYTEQACAQKCTKDGDCARGFACCSANSTFNKYCPRYFPKRAGHCWPAYNHAYPANEGSSTNKSCAAFLDEGASCQLLSAQNNTCGIPANSSATVFPLDGLCSTAEGSVCRLPCTQDSHCPQGYSCGCPKGYAKSTYLTRTICQVGTNTTSQISLRCLK